jgi:hypothetical protein
MGMYNFVHEFERHYPGEYDVDLREIRTKPAGGRTPCRVTQRVLDALDDYTNSLPTSPSAGRVYKKNWGWKRASSEWRPALGNHGYTEGKPYDWMIYFVRNGSWVEHGEKHYGQLHHGFPLVVVDLAELKAA